MMRIEAGPLRIIFEKIKSRALTEEEAEKLNISPEIVYYWRKKLVK